MIVIIYQKQKGNKKYIQIIILTNVKKEKIMINCQKQKLNLNDNIYSKKCKEREDSNDLSQYIYICLYFR